MIDFGEIERVHIGERSMLVSPHVEDISEEHQKKLAELTLACAENFVPEDTYVYLNTGMPTYIGRLDYTVVDGEPQVYEFEERPSGMGISAFVSGEFKDRVSEAFARIGDVTVALSTERQGTDDTILGLPTIPLERAHERDGLVLVRAEPGERGLDELAARSISTVSTKGDKSYGEALGMLKRVDSPDELPSKREAFVVKPLKGSKAHGIMVYHPQKTSEPGFRAYKKIRNHVAQSSVYLQEYHEAMQTGDEHYPSMIYRLFVDLTTGKPEFLGGCYMARKDAVVHGSTFAVIGELCLK